MGKKGKNKSAPAQSTSTKVESEKNIVKVKPEKKEETKVEPPKVETPKVEPPPKVEAIVPKQEVKELLKEQSPLNDEAENDGTSKSKKKRNKNKKSKIIKINLWGKYFNVN